MAIQLHSRSCSSSERGFTFVEVLMALIVISIAASVAMQSLWPQIDSQKRAETQRRMIRVARAIVGEYANGGALHGPDFGFVGDNGALPSSLTQLSANPGAWATWKGPYIQNDFAEASDFATTDAWGAPFTYSGGKYIRSTGSGANIDYSFAKDASDLLNCSFSGSVTGANGLPPSAANAGISAKILCPNGAGGYTTKTSVVDADGSFSFSATPIGLYTVSILDTAGTDDSAQLVVSILPRSSSSTTNIGWLRMPTKNY